MLPISVGNKCQTLPEWGNLHAKNKQLWPVMLTQSVPSKESHYPSFILKNSSIAVAFINVDTSISSRKSRENEESKTKF